MSDQRSQIADLWLRIESWLRQHAPSILSSLPDGASTAELRNLEGELGLSLPEDVQAHLRCHNGSGDAWLHDDDVFLSCDQILESWDQEVDLWDDGNNDSSAKPSGPIKAKWFTAKWVPVLGDWSGNCVCCDLDPPLEGEYGQLIHWYHDEGPTEVLSSSLGQLLEPFVVELEAGVYKVERNRQGELYLAKD